LNVNKLTYIGHFPSFHFVKKYVSEMAVLPSSQSTTHVILSPLHGVNICLDFVIHPRKFEYGYIRASVKYFSF
jgi:hypothetical protein